MIFALPSELHQIPQRLNPIAPVDLLALAIGPAKVMDPDLIDPPFPGAGDLGAEFDFDAEIVAGKVQTFQHIGTKHFVADFDVGQHLIVQHVEDERDHLIAQKMVEIERPVRHAGKA